MHGRFRLWNWFKNTGIYFKILLPIYLWATPLTICFRSKMIKYLVKNEAIESLMQGLRIAGGYVIVLPIFWYHYFMGRLFNYQESLTTISMLGAGSFLIFTQMYVSLSILSQFFAILRRVGEILEMNEFYSNNLSNIVNVEENNYEYDIECFNFDLKAPKLIAITGVVGCGKSTLLSCIMSKILKTNKQVIF